MTDKIHQDRDHIWREMRKRVISFTAVLVLIGIISSFFPLGKVFAMDPLKPSTNFSYVSSDKSKISWKYFTPDPENGYSEQSAIFLLATGAEALSSDKITYSNGFRAKPNPAVLYKTYITSSLKLNTQRVTVGGVYNYSGYAVLTVKDDKVISIITLIRTEEYEWYEILAPTPTNEPDYYGNGTAGVATLSLLNSIAGPFPIKAMPDSASKAGMCSIISNQWSDLKTLIRSIMIPAPGSTPGKSNNDNWIVNDPSGTAIRTELDPTILALRRLMKAAGVSEDMLNKFNFDNLSLSERGNTTFYNIRGLAAELKANIEAGKKLAGGSDKIPDLCGSTYNIKDIKYNVKLEKSLPNLKKFSELGNIIKEAIAFVEEAIGKLDDPDKSDANECGSTDMVSIIQGGIGSVFTSSICNFGIVINKFFVSLLNYAVSQFENITIGRDF